MSNSEYIILTNNFKKSHSNYLELGYSILKSKDNDLTLKLFQFEELNNIKLTLQDVISFIDMFVKNKLYVYDIQLLDKKDPIINNNDNLTIFVKKEVFNNLMHCYAKDVPNKQYFEILPWMYTFAELNVKYYHLYLLLKKLFIIVKKHKKLFYKILKDNNIEIEKRFEEFLSTFIETKTVKNFIGCIKDYKLDFTGSGQILISILINDEAFLEFSNVSRKDRTNILGGYDKVLNIFKGKYKEIHNYANIDTFLLLFENSIIRNRLKNLIFSRNTVKNDLMVKGYSGTLFGSADKIYNKIKHYLDYNCYPIYNNNANIIKELKKMSRKIAKELDSIIEELCPAISERYLKLIKNIVEDIKDDKDKDIIIPNPIMTYHIKPRKREEIEMKLNLIDISSKKLKRSSRRIISYYTLETDYKRLKRSLGADIIQGFDAVVAYYIKKIIQLLNPSLRVATIFDAFIFSEHISLDVFRNISRLACQLTFKENFVENLIKSNNITNNEFYQSFKDNIFNSIKGNVLEQIVESSFFTYLLNNQNKWLFTNNQCNLKFFLNSFNYLNTFEIEKYNKFLIMENFSNEENTLEELRDLYKLKFIFIELRWALDELYRNFYMNNINHTISTLNEIMNNNDFIK